MIPIDRKDQTRQETEAVSNKESNTEQPSKIKKDVPVTTDPETASEEINNDTQEMKTTPNDEYVFYKYFQFLFS
jgi:hypothetical protein